MSTAASTADPAAGNPPAATGITQEQLHTAIEKARLEEREKLRQQLEQANARVTVAEGKVTELQTENTRLKDTVSSLEKAKTTGGEIDVKKLISEVTSTIEGRILSSAQKEREDRDKELTLLRGRVTAFELRELQDKLVEEVGGYDKVVKAVIRGSTEDELRASVKAAHEAFVELENRFKPAAPAAPAPGAPAAGPVTANGQGNPATATRVPVSTAPPVVAPTTQGGVGSATEGGILPSVRELSPKDYKANRERIQQDLARRYPAAGRK